MGKWIEISDVRQPVGEVAIEILQLRMQVVEQRLPQAAHEFQCDIEHVHQLRVGCRRAGAALEALDPLFGDKAKRLRKWLRKLRRAAGPARDADVLLERFRAEPDSQSTPAYLVAQLERRRSEVQQALIDIAEKAASGRLRQSVTRCLTALQKPFRKMQRERFDLFAQDALQSASREMFQLTILEQPTVAQLHQLRIAGKRLRYSIELFHSAFPVALRKKVYPQIEEIQARLGQLNDHATAQALFQHWMSEQPAGELAAQLAAQIVKEQQAIKESGSNFLQWWTPGRAEVLESDFRRLINDPH